ncbi:MAG: SsrA-binding protein SmpB [Pseudomonadota bacterium]
MAAKKSEPGQKIAAENRKARHNYFIENDLEVGIMLAGSEVKSLREGKGQIAESYASVEDGELWLINSYIPAYDKAKTFGHEERRRRKLLAKSREIARLWQEIGREGATLVPLKIYFNEKGVAKLQLGIAKGKKMSDKRDTEKKRDWQRDKARLMRARG